MKHKPRDHILLDRLSHTLNGMKRLLKTYCFSSKLRKKLHRWSTWLLFVRVVIMLLKISAELLRLLPKAIEVVQRLFSKAMEVLNWLIEVLL